MHGILGAARHCYCGNVKKSASAPPIRPGAFSVGMWSAPGIRRFTEQLGTSPGQWLLGQRIDAARALLEQTDLPVETIAERVGLASAVNLRRRFRAHLGTTPGACRRTFGET